jgi:hypothetical protein
MVDHRGDTHPAELRDQRGGLFDRFGPVVVGAARTGAAAGADYGCAGFAEGSGDAPAGAPSRTGYDRHTAAKRIRVGCPWHS